MTYGLKPLSSEVVIKLTLQVWRTKFNQFWKIGLIASLWSALNAIGFLLVLITLMSAILAGLLEGEDSSVYIDIGLILIFLGFNQGLSILSGSIIIPLWQVTKGVIYSNLCHRMPSS